jgi:hypothetical protein
VNILSRNLLQDSKGYDPALITWRRHIVSDLYSSPDYSQRAQALDQILSLNRPVVILLERISDAELEKWLAKLGTGKALFENAEFSVWLLPSLEPGRAARLPPE